MPQIDLFGNDVVEVKDHGDQFMSRVYTDRPAYADYDAPRKFMAIEGIIATRLNQHPKAICSYSGGSDSDILIDLIERTRQMIRMRMRSTA